MNYSHSLDSIFDDLPEPVIQLTKDEIKKQKRKIAIRRHYEKNKSITVINTDNTKKCYTCKVIKELDSFSKNIGCKDGYANRCKECVSIYRKTDKGKSAKQQPINISDDYIFRCIVCNIDKDITHYYLETNSLLKHSSVCIPCIKERRKAYKETTQLRVDKNKEELETKKKLGLLSIDPILCIRCNIIQDISQFRTNYNHKSGYRPVCKSCISISRNTDECRSRNNNLLSIRYKNDTNFKISKILRARIKAAFKAKDIKKVKKSKELISCDFEFFKSYLEAQFQDGMSWDNMGEWHIDHIIPVSSFNLSTIEEQLKAFHYTNMQPLWKADNLSKHDKIVDEDWYLQRGIVRKRDDLPVYK